jgi:tetratricopeptide (TPR) repeat protein
MAKLACPQCGFENIVERNTCRNCGALLHTQQAASTPQALASGTEAVQREREPLMSETTFTCPNPDCGAEIPTDVEKCPVCGTDLYMAMIEHATEEIKKNPKDATNYMARGYAYGAKGDNERAIADLDYAIRLDPKFADAYTLRGSNRIDMGDHRAAIADLNYAIKLAPNEADAYFYRGVAYSSIKETKSAMADFEQALRLAPNHINTYIQRAMLFDDQGNTSRAIGELERALQIATDPYERTQIEDMLGKLREFRGQIRRKQAGNIFVAILSGLWRATIAFIRAVTRG